MYFNVWGRYLLPKHAAWVENTNVICCGWRQQVWQLLNVLFCLSMSHIVTVNCCNWMVLENRVQWRISGIWDKQKYPVDNEERQDLHRQIPVIRVRNENTAQSSVYLKTKKGNTTLERRATANGNAILDTQETSCVWVSNSHVHQYWLAIVQTAMHFRH